ncbi:MAG: hypothetical protein IKL06_02965 [Lachnospiraceae bacterium]|nr:hypothetical protein [Lachnospiraceae bacterium]
MNQTERQRAFDYSMYVMLSSYFDKTVCTTKLQEKKLCLAYQELKDEIKQDYDESSIKIIEKELLPKLPRQFTQQQMDLALLGSTDKACTEIRLQNDDYVLRIKSRYSKRAPKMVYEVWRKKVA